MKYRVDKQNGIYILYVVRTGREIPMMTSRVRSYLDVLIDYIKDIEDSYGKIY